jgi:hypothetical protein
VAESSYEESVRYSSSLILDLSSLEYPYSEISYIIAGSALRGYFLRTSDRVGRSPSSVLSLSPVS